MTSQSSINVNNDLGGPFGAAQQFAENLVALGTTSAVFAQMLSLATPVLLAGTYRVGVVFQYEGSTGSTVGEHRVQVDNVTDIDIETLNLASASERKTYSNINQVVLAAGAHTIDLDVRRSSGAGTFTMDDAKLEIWRVA